jgi:hypothetical protein
MQLRQAWLGGLIALVGAASCSVDDPGGDQINKGGGTGGAANSAGGNANNVGGSATNGTSGDGAGGTAMTGTGGDGAGGAATGSGGTGTGGQSGSAGGGTGGSGGAKPLDAGAPANDASAASGCVKGVKPDATNTGVPKGVTLTVVNADVNVTKDNTTIDSQDIHGFVIISASHVKITRSIVRGGVATQNGDGIRVKSGTDILIEDVEVALDHPSAFLDGVGVSNTIVRRANIHGGVDGLKMSSNSTLECSYVHDLSYFDVDPNQNGGPTHNDGIQILEGANIHVIGNQLVTAKNLNAAIQVTQDFGVVTNLVIESNWADGGGCTFNIAHKVEASLTVTVQNNRFGRNTGFTNCPILESTKTTLVGTGNVWDDNGMAVPIQTHD